jgi:gamma-glutamyltranspeptidase / glutathione hydrolase
VSGSFTTRPELAGSFGMVASTHWLATASAMAVLEAGGNAFDAAVAGGFVLQVVEPDLNGPGGDLPVALWSAQRREPLVICGQGVSPASASIGLMRDELGLELVPGTGLLAACVPGAFDAWLLLLREFGTMRLRDVLAYAVRYAGGGFPITTRVSRAIGAVAELFTLEWPTSAAVWLVRGRPPAPRTTLRNLELAATYERIIDEAEAATADRDGQIEHARNAWLRGWVAEAMVGWTSSNEVLDASGRRHAGLLTGGDLAAWSATVEQPVRQSYADLEICKTGPWGQGPVMLQTLRLLEGFDLAAIGRDTAAYVHTVIEALKLAFADREAFYGDPGSPPVPLQALLSWEYASQRRALIEERASAEFRPGSPAGIPGRMPRGAAAPLTSLGMGEPTIGDTCHLDVGDRHGNLVSCTPSGGWMQSSPAIPGLGFCLGTRAQMFWLEDGLPSSLAGGRRPRTTLSPTLALRDGEGAIAFGTPGGDQQDQWSLQLLLNHVVFGMNLQEAIDAPAFHTDHLPSSFWPRRAEPRRLQIEDRWSPAVVSELRRRGHDVVVRPPWSLGRLSAVARDADGTLRAAADPRGMHGYAAGR